MLTPAFPITATERILPRLALDFTTASLDPRVTFARAANTATRINSSGLIETVNADLPRFDYTLNTGGVCKGLLIEETRTNIAFHSSDVLSGGWLQTIYNGAGVNYYTVTNVASPTPGPGNANYFVATATPGNIAARQTGVSLASGTTQTVSAYVYVPSQAGLSAWRFDVNFTGDYGAGANIAVFDQWVRVSHTVVMTGTRTQVDFNVLRANGGTPTEGMKFYMTNMQIEAGGFVTSYIPTTTGPSTRNSDVVTMTGTNFSDWFNASEGTFALGAMIASNADFKYLFAASTGAVSNIIAGRRFAGGVLADYVATGGSEVVDQAVTGTMTVNVPFNYAVGYKTNNVGHALNSGAIKTDTSAAIPTGLNILNIGARNSGFDPWGGWISSLRYFPQRLTDNEIVAFSK